MMGIVEEFEILVGHYEFEHEKSKWASLTIIDSHPRALGTCTLNDRHKPTPWISSMAVGESYRRKGLGTQLLNAAIELAREAGATGLNLWVHKDNAAAIGLYKKCGFIFCSDPADGTGLQMMYRPISGGSQ